VPVPAGPLQTQESTLRDSRYLTGPGEDFSCFGVDVKCLVGYELRIVTILYNANNDERAFGWR